MKSSPASLQESHAASPFNIIGLKIKINRIFEIMRKIPKRSRRFEADDNPLLGTLLDDFLHN